MRPSRFSSGIVTFVLSAIAVLPLGAQVQDLAALSDKAFSAWSSPAAPGCVVGIDRPGQPRFTRAYGAAELEHGIPNQAETVFEAGSVSKQFTAAATVVLAMDGKLGLDDDVRKYVPELPRYERPITIRHLLNHTSGLRDWGDIVSLEGWPRGRRAFTHDDVLQVIARQSASNYPAGDRYSYTNSGYNLLAIIVSRVSGKSFASFSEERVFRPLGMHHTQWRDDYTRLVKGRAQAYSPDANRWELDMPFENVHGNGGLLTTVTDLLTWTAVLENPPAAWRAIVDSLHVRGRLTNGDTIPYALGLFVDKYRGLLRVEHSGATAGYRADVARFPGKGLAIAILCNAATAAPGNQLRQLSDALLAAVLTPVVVATPPARNVPVPWKPTAGELAGFTGMFYSADVGSTLTISIENGALVLFRPSSTRVTLRPTVTDHFAGFAQDVWFTRGADGRVSALHARTGRAYDVVYEVVHAKRP